MVELAHGARSEQARAQAQASRDQTGCRVTLFIIQISACPVIIRGKPFQLRLGPSDVLRTCGLSAAGPWFLNYKL